MNKKIAICGLDCASCGAYQATIVNDDGLREKTAKEWAEKYGNKGLKPEDINCLGCLSQVEPIFSNCRVCEYRLCGLEKKVENCSQCGEYPCEKISKFHKEVPSAKANCEELKTEH